MLTSIQYPQIQRSYDPFIFPMHPSHCPFRTFRIVTNLAATPFWCINTSPFTNSILIVPPFTSSTERDCCASNYGLGKGSKPNMANIVKMVPQRRDVRTPLNFTGHPACKLRAHSPHLYKIKSPVFYLKIHSQQNPYCKRKKSRRFKQTLDSYRRLHPLFFHRLSHRSETKDIKSENTVPCTEKWAKICYDTWLYLLHQPEQCA